MVSHRESHQIHFLAGEGCLGMGKGAGRIDRTKPYIVAPHMQDHEWNQFCDDIDAPGLSKKKYTPWILLGLFAPFIWIVIMFIPSPLPHVVKVSVAAVLFFLMFVTCYFGGKMSKNIRGEWIRICKEASDKHPSLTFQVKELTRGDEYFEYIEVSTDEEAVVPTVQAAVLPSAPSEPNNAAQRMMELEKMKHLLTEEEYERKRAEILASS